MSNAFNLRHLPAKIFDLNNASSNICVSNVFAEREASYLNEFNMYLAYFNRVPNFIHEIDINCKKADEWFYTNYKEEIKDHYFARRYINRLSKSAALDDIFYFLFDDLIVDFDTNQSIVRFLFRETNIERVEAIIKGVKKFKIRKGRRKPEMLLLTSTRTGISTLVMHINKPGLNIDENYNDDFKEVHQIILRRLSKKDDKGLVLLHGKSGTGKTSYIRYLISKLRKNVIFLPPNMASAITNPDLISILICNSNSIFVIEDAENIVVDREKDGRSPVSALLNISDGLLSDCLNVQIICSFNTDISKVDSALMRKGRLIAKYEFKELDVYKANALSQKLGFNTRFDTPIALTGIYNQGEKEFQNLKRDNLIGFRK